MASKPPKPATRPRNTKIMTAIHDYMANEADELSFKAGDIVYVLDMSETDWWKARIKGKEGQVPSNYLEATSHDGSTSPLHDAAKRGTFFLPVFVPFLTCFLPVFLPVFYPQGELGAAPRVSPQ